MQSRYPLGHVRVSALVYAAQTPNKSKMQGPGVPSHAEHGVTVGGWVGCAVGARVGAAVGDAVGAVGAAVGEPDGAADGAAEGAADGAAVGATDGAAVGVAEGAAVGGAVPQEKQRDRHVPDALPHTLMARQNTGSSSPKHS